VNCPHPTPDFRFGRDIGQSDLVTAAAVLFGSLPAGGIDEDAAHGFRGGREEMSAVVPANVGVGADKSEVRLVDKGSRLKCLVVGFGCQARSGKLPQLVVDEREQVGGRLAVACRGGVQKQGHVGHDKILLDFQGGDRLKAHRQSAPPNPGLTYSLVRI